MPDVDAIVTDEESIVAGGPVMQAWHGLRVAQRHQTMSSLGLSRRLPGITGRMSIHPAGRHRPWLHRGARTRLPRTRAPRIPATGEDQSTWLWLLRRGRRMLYLPDVRTVTIEHPPAKRLLPATAS